MKVFPYGWRDASTAAFAAQHRAVVAAGRLERPGGSGAAAPSLSPVSLLTCDVVPRLVLPSPNGSSISAALVDGAATVAAGCLRNARAVADWLHPQLADGACVAVIAAGERWPEDATLRPALEDQLGAGAILSALIGRDRDHRLSPEARAAAALFDATASRLREMVHGCVSGRELVGRGFGGDVDVAVDRDRSRVVPVLADGAFAPAVSTG